ncbi:hypothetical protein Tco_0887516 [Tanacetum coccineum]
MLHHPLKQTYTQPSLHNLPQLTWLRYSSSTPHDYLAMLCTHMEVIGVKKLEASDKGGEGKKTILDLFVSDADDDSSKQRRGRKFSKEGFKDDEGQILLVRSSSKLLLLEYTFSNVEKRTTTQKKFRDKEKIRSAERRMLDNGMKKKGKELWMMEAKATKKIDCGKKERSPQRPTAKGRSPFLGKTTKKRQKLEVLRKMSSKDSWIVVPREETPIED